MGQTLKNSGKDSYICIVVKLCCSFAAIDVWRLHLFYSCAPSGTAHKQYNGF